MCVCVCVCVWCTCLCTCLCTCVYMCPVCMYIIPWLQVNSNMCYMCLPIVWKLKFVNVYLWNVMCDVVMVKVMW